MSEEKSLVSGLAGRYATALFDLTVQSDEIEPVMLHLNIIDRIFSESPDFARFAKSPLIRRSDQVMVMGMILDKLEIHGLAAKFSGVVAENRRLYLLPEMIRQFRTLLSIHNGEIDAEVTSCVALSDKQIAILQEKLSKSVESKVNLTTIIDPNILGGLIVRIGSRMIDSSIRTKLNNLQLSLKEAG